MGRALLILLLLANTFCIAQKRSVTVSDLLTLATLSPKNAETYLNKKGFTQGDTKVQDGVMVRTFHENGQNKVAATEEAAGHTVELYKKGDLYCYLLHTSSADEYKESNSILKKAGFFYDTDTSQPHALIFKKGGITVRARSVTCERGSTRYNFLLQKKEFPDPGSVQFGEDLLKFESHDHLANFFGADNIKKDVYYLHPDQPTHCTVLFPNSSRQAMFIWEDEKNLHNISFIMISGVLKTTSTVQFDGNFNHSAWKFRSGLYLGMRLKDLLQLNMNDFLFFGQESEYSFMVVPEKTRYVDFKNIGVMFDCFDCYSSPVLKKEKVSALDAADMDLAIYISCIMIRP
ncbi:MAG: hypothetical protein JNK14_19205 [Chitinophagaceae bacterium]|nr:hypothetical protein [Chitinophagaceae bacterium]